jgi:hypothetical protein
MIHAVSSASAKRILAAHIAVALFFILCFVSHASAQQTTPAPPLITQPIDESQRTVLHGNTHPSARPQYDLGTAPAALPLQRMLLVLKRSPQQELALRKLLDNQQDKSSPSYHQWLTPQQFGQQFGPTDLDLETITAWLQSHGFQVGTTKGRTVLEFSGSASQVQEAFHTSIHKYIVNGAQHWANSTDPSIPTALTPAIAGIASLNNFPRHPMYVRAGTFSREKATGKITPIQPQFTFPSGCVENNNDQNACEYGLGPYDFATIYNLLPLWNTNINGTGQTIAIVAESNINPQDVADFRSLFDLPANSTANGNPLNIILNGPDPGLQGDETEADLDVQWSGAVAPYATLDFVVSQSTETTSGVDLSAVYIVDNNLAPVMSESYGACELALGTAGNQFYSTLWFLSPPETAAPPAATTSTRPRLRPPNSACKSAAMLPLPTTWPSAAPTSTISATPLRIGTLPIIPPPRPQLKAIFRKRPGTIPAPTPSSAPSALALTPKPTATIRN